MKLLDCPGIVLDDSDAGATLLRNWNDAEAITDSTRAVAAVLKRCSPEQLMEVRWPPRVGILFGSLLLPSSVLCCSSLKSATPRDETQRPLTRAAISSKASDSMPLLVRCVPFQFQRWWFAFGGRDCCESYCGVPALTLFASLPPPSPWLQPRVQNARDKNRSSVDGPVRRAILFLFLSPNCRAPVEAHPPVHTVSLRQLFAPSDLA